MRVTLIKGGFLPPGGSPYWCDHLHDWRKLRQYREDLKRSDKCDEVSVEVNVEEWAKNIGVKANKEEAFLASGGFKKVVLRTKPQEVTK